MMKTHQLTLLAAAIAALGLALPGTARAQDATEAAAPETDLLSVDDLDALMAPVALYPDTLLAQVFMASTYPLDVVKAGRFVEQNAEMSDKDRAAAAQTMDWDPSVQALVAGFPDLITRMNDHIDWTEQVGDAVLVQTEDVMDSVQRLRDQAAETGYLTSNDAQTVTVSTSNEISIAPTNPQVVYVPAYDPGVVYTQPAPAQVVYVDDGYGNDFGNALATGAIVFGTAMILDDIFDDNDPWDDYWRGPSHVDWDDHDFNPRPNVNVNGDVNIGNSFTNIKGRDGDVTQSIGDRTRLDIDADRGGRIGSIDRDGIDRNNDREFRADSDKRNEARDKIAARKTSGERPATLPAAGSRERNIAAGAAAAGAKPRLAKENKRVDVKRPDQKPAANIAAKRSTNATAPKIPKNAVKKSPQRSSAFQQSGGSRAKAASSRGKASSRRR